MRRYPQEAPARNGPFYWPFVVGFVVGRPGLEPGTLGLKVRAKCFRRSSLLTEIGHDLRHDSRCSRVLAKIRLDL
jgi:hypothetical protein